MKIILGATLITLLLGCAGIPKQSKVLPEGGKYFAGKKGCFLLYNMTTSVFDEIIGDETCRERFPACSTFKIPLAVMAFDSGVLRDENQILKWDGVRDTREVSNRDHNAKTWIRDSVVWFSQRITPQLGKKRLQQYLSDMNYGNKDISAGITRAWLVSPAENKPALKISAYEQVEFMKNLWTNSLPVSKRAMRLTREITFLEELLPAILPVDESWVVQARALQNSAQGIKLSGKTGSSFYDKERRIRFGWFVSHLEKGDQEYIAVTNFSDTVPSSEFGYGGLQAKEITKKILASRGLW